MLQSLDKQTDKCPLLWPGYRKSSIEIYKLTKVPSISNEESVGWNLGKLNCKSVTSARLMD